ncbi:MAG: histidine kinase [Aestuariibacter sp.]
MKYSFYHSTVFRISALMLSIGLLAMVSMLSTFVISENAELDAKAVNESGALRMKSYRMLALYLDSENDQRTELLQQAAGDFEGSLFSSTFSNQFNLDNSESLVTQYDRVTRQWQENIKPLLLDRVEKANNASQLIVDMPLFVANINDLVNGFQSHAEQNTSSIRLIQILALFGTISLIFFAMINVSRNIEKPLNTLTRVARQIKQGNYTAVADESGKDELAILAQTINKMSQSIFRSQTSLEERIRVKTQELSKNKASLQLLFDVSRKMYEMPPGDYDFDAILDELSETTGVKDLDLCVMTESGSVPYFHLLTENKDLPEKCRIHDCGSCISNPTMSQSTEPQMKYPLVKDGSNYGVLVVNPAQNQQLDDWQHQLFAAVAEQVAICLSMKEQRAQDRRISLLNERTVIARELHDSLAQALSYLKIQVTRLQKLKDKEAPPAQMDEVIDELKGGLSSAYRELRELLTTFRLKLDEQNLKGAFEQTIQQLKKRSEDFTFAIDYQVEHVPFTPQEEIHLMQIAREAMQNAFYHSKGNRISVALVMIDEATITLSVKDNGVGIPGDPKKMNHYGLAIMEERARNLQGKVNYKNLPEGGTEVLLTFVPDYLRQESKQLVNA